MRVRGAFTLIEILIVLVIVGLLLSVALPNVGRSVSRDRVNRAAMVVQSMLGEAGQLAARRNEPMTVTFASGMLRINRRSTGAAVKQRRFTGSDLRATVSMNPSAGITVFPNGRGSAAVTVTLTGGGETAIVSRSTTGVIRRQ